LVRPELELGLPLAHLKVLDWAGDINPDELRKTVCEVKVIKFELFKAPKGSRRGLGSRPWYLLSTRKYQVVQ
jgi:hypothetical protein